MNRKDFLNAKSYSEKGFKERFNFWLDDNRWVAVILGVVSVGGLLAVGLFAPNVLILLRKRKNNFGGKERKLLSDTRHRLLGQGYIKRVRSKNGQYTYKITKKGLKRLFDYNLEFELSKKNKITKWDKKWRLLLFDYPNTRQSVRDSIRRIAKNFGFFQFQKNVCVYPYSDAYDILDYFHLLHGQGRDNLVVLTANCFVGDSVLREHFNL